MFGSFAEYLKRLLRALFSFIFTLSPSKNLFETSSNIALCKNVTDAFSAKMVTKNLAFTAATLLVSWILRTVVHSVEINLQGVKVPPIATLRA